MLQVAQPVGEDAPVQSGQPAVIVVEPARADHQLSDDQQGPSVSDRLAPIATGQYSDYWTVPCDGELGRNPYLSAWIVVS
jgi:hypothetical protein